MKRVLLVNANIARAPYPAPPIGISLVAAGIPESFEVRVYDGVLDGGSGLGEVLSAFEPDYIGIGIRNIDDMSMQRGSYFIESIAAGFASPILGRKKGKVILGGAGFSLFPQELMDLFRADYGIVGEGEEAFAALLKALERGSGAGDIAGLLLRRAGGIETTPRASHPAGRLDLKFSRIDRRIDYTPYAGRGAYPVQTKRGCACRCVYCTYPFVEGSTYRMRRPSDVVDEIEEAAARLGPVTFEFVDSTFNSPPGHAEAVCSEIAGRKLRLRLRTMGVNPGGVSDELLGLMKEAGFAQIDCTPDSASPAMLVSLGKNFTRQELEEASRLLRRHELPTMWFFLFGGPGETEETLEESFDFIRRFVPEEDMVHMTEGLRIYPGTPLHARAVEEGFAGEGESLLAPRFYVSRALGRERLQEILIGIEEELPNCVRSCESTPGRAMMEAAVKERLELGLEEPMFRTLLRLRRRGYR